MSHIYPHVDTKYVDLVIKFIGALNLPRVHIMGMPNPFFYAKLDDKVVYASSVKPTTLSPVWNETWIVNMVPSTATLSVVVRHTESGSFALNDIGGFKTTINPGSKEVEIVGKHLAQDKGSFWLNILTSPSALDSSSPSYSFDGPIHYSRHDSPTLGALTKLSDSRLYSTWKIYIKGVPRFFGDTMQHWNQDYKPAQAIFQGPTSIALRSGIVAAHRMLYARTPSSGFGTIAGADDMFQLLHGGSRSSSSDGNHPFAHRIKPAVYTYVIAKEDESFRFSETGAAFFVNCASKHALHSSCAEHVVYSGEFHPRPEGGWDTFSDETDDSSVTWELVIDNNSGTYSPDPRLLDNVVRLLEFNFPGIKVLALEHDNPGLKKSTRACREYALIKRGTGLELNINMGLGDSVSSLSSNRTQ